MSSRGPRAAVLGNEPHHSARYDIDERALEVGFAMMVALGRHGQGP